jgi:hypothetical protein
MASGGEFNISSRIQLIIRGGTEWIARNFIDEVSQSQNISSVIGQKLLGSKTKGQDLAVPKYSLYPQGCMEIRRKDME